MTAMGTAKTDLESAGVAATAVFHGPEKTETDGKKVAHTYGTAEHIVLGSEKDDETLIAMTTHGPYGMGRWLMGSVADRVVRHAAGPVMVLRG